MPKEYIEREATLKEAESGIMWGASATAVYEAIQEAPAADVAPVVRCRECKHAYINSFSAASGVALCRLLTKRAEGIQIAMQQDDFCSYGEPR